MNIDRESLRQLRMDVSAALKGVCDKHSLSFEIGAITYEPGSDCRFRVMMRQSNVGKIGSPWANNVIEVKPGDRILVGKRTHIYVGPRSGRKYKHTTLSEGKRYKLTDAQVRSGLQPALA